MSKNYAREHNKYRSDMQINGKISAFDA